MSTLGLSGPAHEDESLWKRLLWPSVRTAHDADLLGQQGFWIAQVIAVLSAVLLLFGDHPLAAIATFFFYFLGGVGLRETSVTAASLVFLAFLLDRIAGVVTHMGGIGIIPIIVLAILLANLRGAVLIARWKKTGRSEEDESEPMRFSETLRDKFCDQMPRKIWPWGRFIFYIYGGCFVALELVGVCMWLAGGHRTSGF